MPDTMGKRLLLTLLVALLVIFQARIDPFRLRIAAFLGREFCTEACHAGQTTPPKPQLALQHQQQQEQARGKQSAIHGSN